MEHNTVSGHVVFLLLSTCNWHPGWTLSLLCWRFSLRTGQTQFDRRHISEFSLHSSQPLLPDSALFCFCSCWKQMIFSCSSVCVCVLITHIRGGDQADRRKRLPPLPVAHLHHLCGLLCRHFPLYWTGTVSTASAFYLSASLTLRNRVLELLHVSHHWLNLTHSPIRPIQYLTNRAYPGCSAQLQPHLFLL